jgi:hypothetical protein
MVDALDARKTKTPRAKSFAGFFFYCADCLANFLLVPKRGLEPPHLAAHGPEPCASTNSATWANRYSEECYFSGRFEAVNGLSGNASKEGKGVALDRVDFLLYRCRLTDQAG